MTVPTLSVSPAPVTELDADCVVVGVVSDEGGAKLAIDDPSVASAVGSLASLGVTGARDELVRLPGLGAAKSLAVIGLGPGEVTTDKLRYAAGAAVRQLPGVETVALALPITDAAGLGAVLEGAGIGAYSFTRYRQSSLDAAKLPATSVIVQSDIDHDASTIERALSVVDACAQVRDLVNIPALDLYPESFADAVLEHAADRDVEVTVLAEQELTAGGYGGILGVGLGSERGPRLVKIAYSPAGAARHLALVGKGITFDTGGLSLKPATSMVGMKFDMAGAATVMAVILAAARLQLPVRLTGWLCLAENMPSGTAIRPGDVLRIRGGRTVEVLNTDAEGRLVLADGLVAAGEENPDAIIDIATLTGAAITALGNRYTGVMGHDELVDRVLTAAKAVGEPMWGMPLPEELRASLNTDVADIANAKIGSAAGGMLLAGVFLQEFIGTSDGEKGTRIPWAHLDIAGSSNNGSSPYGFTGKGPTAVGVRTLLAVAEDFSRA